MRSRRDRYREEDEEPIELFDALEPYEPMPEDWGDDWNEVEMDVPPEPIDMEQAQDYAYDDYSDEHEALDIWTRFKVAMGVFDTVSILVGVLVILLLVAILVSLVNWLGTDITHSITLLQSGLQ